jgi:hypothetical protein
MTDEMKDIVVAVIMMLSVRSAPYLYIYGIVDISTSKVSVSKGCMVKHRLFGSSAA